MEDMGLKFTPVIGIVSRSQTAFSSFIFRREEKGLITLHWNFLATKSPKSGDC